MILPRFFLVGIFLLGVFPWQVKAASEIFPTVTAKAIAVYGWKDGNMTPLYVKKEHTLFPIASLTKLITAKAVEDLYDRNKVFTISKTAEATYGTTNGIVAGAQFTRDDLLKALLVHSSNDAAVAFMEGVGNTVFLEKMNAILHTGKYTATLFNNPSGLDPTQKNIKPNRMTPYKLTLLLNDIYNYDNFLRDILSRESVSITDLTSDTTTILKQTNALYQDESYKNKVLMGKTGLTKSAGQNLAFVAPSPSDTYDYVTIVLLGSKNRTVDSKKILQWIDTVSEAFGG